MRKDSQAKGEGGVKGVGGWAGSMTHVAQCPTPFALSPSNPPSPFADEFFLMVLLFATYLHSDLCRCILLHCGSMQLHHTVYHHTDVFLLVSLTAHCHAGACEHLTCRKHAVLCCAVLSFTSWQSGACHADLSGSMSALFKNYTALSCDCLPILYISICAFRI